MPYIGAYDEAFLRAKLFILMVFSGAVFPYKNVFVIH
jgi:hypothetical protein